MGKPFDLEKQALAYTLTVVVTIFLIFQFGLRYTMKASSVVELEKALIEVTGFILAFTGVIYSVVFSQIRTKEPKAKRTLAIRLGIGAIGAFAFLFFGLVVCVWTLVVSLNLAPDFEYSVAPALVAPLSYIAAAFVSIIVGMWRLTVTED